MGTAIGIIVAIVIIVIILAITTTTPHRGESTTPARDPIVPPSEDMFEKGSAVRLSYSTPHSQYAIGSILNIIGTDLYEVLFENSDGIQEIKPLGYYDILSMRDPVYVVLSPNKGKMGGEYKTLVEATQALKVLTVEVVESDDFEDQNDFPHHITVVEREQVKTLNEKSSQYEKGEFGLPGA